MTVHELFWVANVGNDAINCIVICMRPKMVMEFGFTKWNRCWLVAVNSNPRV